MSNKKKPSVKSRLIDIKKRIANKLNRIILPQILPIRLKHNWASRKKGQAHGLPGVLVVSLTSYPARFHSLSLTLKSILIQSVTADKVILWIAYEDKEALPEDVLNLQKFGLKISFCNDIKSYKKIIPTLQMEPDAFIVTADDDTFYPSNWLEEFVSSFDGNLKVVLCQRSHKIKLNNFNCPRPYFEWNLESNDPEPSTLSLATGNGGVLYPPGIFFSDVFKSELFNELCPKADDIWLYWMVRLNGGKYRNVGHRTVFYTWKRTQEVSLWHNHNSLNVGGNDVQIKAMVKEYGFPIL